MGTDLGWDFSARHLSTGSCKGSFWQSQPGHGHLIEGKDTVYLKSKVVFAARTGMSLPPSPADGHFNDVLLNSS